MVPPCYQAIEYISFEELWKYIAVGYCGCLSGAEPIYHDSVTPGERYSPGDPAQKLMPDIHTPTHTHLLMHMQSRMH